MALRMDAAALRVFLDQVFPQVADEFEIIALQEHYLEVALKIKDMMDGRYVLCAAREQLSIA